MHQNMAVNLKPLQRKGFSGKDENSFNMINFEVRKKSQIFVFQTNK